MGLNERIDSLPPEMQVEVADFVEYLHQKRARQQLAESADKILGKEIQQDNRLYTSLAFTGGGARQCARTPRVSVGG
jgi:hypothetical protein